MTINIAMIGNPNSGKTTLFNALVGGKQRVGNWSGVTVEKKDGLLAFGDGRVAEISDLPGVYSLDHEDGGASIDERIAFDYMMGGLSDVVLNVIDASALERNLYLTVQLLELGLPIVVVLNKMDIANKLNLVIDEKALSKQLGCPVICLSAYDKVAVNLLVERISVLDFSKLISFFCLDYGDVLEPAIEKISELFIPISPSKVRVTAIKCLENDQSILKGLLKNNRLQIESYQKKLDIDIDLQIADTRYTFIYDLTQYCVRSKGYLSKSLTEKIDVVALNRYAGIPFFLLVMYLMFMFSINVGSAFIDFFDIASGAIFVDEVRNLLLAIHAPDWVISVVAEGVGNGVQTVMTFIPIIACLFLTLSVLETSGYLARAAFIVDRAMQYIGLPGKSFVPMIVGLGCTVPAIMAARTSDKERERLLTIIMSPFISCGARLPVYALFASAFFPLQGQNIVFLLYLIGIVVAVLTGFILSRTVLPGHSESLLLAIPDYQMPTIKHTLIQTWQKLKTFIFGAGKTIVIVVTCLNITNSIGVDGSFGHQDSESSLLSQGAKLITPMLSPLGIQEDNWPATVGLITGLFAKETIVGTLNNLYMALDEEEEIELTLAEKLNVAVATIPDNLMGIDVSDLLGLRLDPVSDLALTAEELGVSLTIYSNIHVGFGSSEAAFAYLLFILLYTPCIAALGAIVREIGRKWATFIALWSLCAAYMISVAYYQVATFSLHPSKSAAYLLLIATIVFVAIYALKKKGSLLAGGPVKHKAPSAFTQLPNEED